MLIPIPVFEFSDAATGALSAAAMAFVIPKALRHVRGRTTVEAQAAPELERRGPTTPYWRRLLFWLVIAAPGFALGDGLSRGARLQHQADVASLWLLAGSLAWPLGCAALLTAIPPLRRTLMSAYQ